MNPGVLWQWIAVGILVILAVVFFVRRLRKDPCRGCALSDKCNRKDRKC